LPKKSRKSSSKSSKSNNSKKQVPKFIIILACAAVGIGVILYVMEGKNTGTNLQSQDYNQTEQAYAQNIIDTCKSAMHCPVTGLDNLTKTENRQIVLGTFADLVTLYDHTYPCHEIAHHLGLWLYGYTQDLNESLPYAKMECGGAVFHGIMQNYFMTEQFHGIPESQIQITKLCPQEPDNPYSMIHWQCIHGLGHGLTAYYNNNVTEAVTRCDEFKSGFEQLSCSKGVFMQNMVSYFETGQGDVSPTDIYFPCDTVSDKYAPACYHYHATYLLKLANSSIPAAFDLCDKITPGTMVKYCYHGMGRQLATLITSEATIKSGMSTCYLGKESQYYADCLNGMLLTVLNGDTNTYAGFKFCSMIEDSFKPDCYDSLGKWIKMLYPTQPQWETECSKAEDQIYVPTCLGASLDNQPLL
jgi:hypothetical protein